MIPDLSEFIINDYMISLHPGEELTERIQFISSEFRREFRAESAPVAGVSLAMFKALDMQEHKIASRLSGILGAFAPFKVELRDFGSHPTHTIYINVTSKMPIQTLVKAIKGGQSLLRLDKNNKPLFPDDVIIPIATRLKPWQYEKAWLRYSNLEFTGRFIAGGLQLLKKPPGGKKYQLVKTFEFMNQTAKGEQGNLFF